MQTIQKPHICCLNQSQNCNVKITGLTLLQISKQTKLFSSQQKVHKQQSTKFTSKYTFEKKQHRKSQNQQA